MAPMPTASISVTVIETRKPDKQLIAFYKVVILYNYVHYERFI